ncbi:hypothetical protein SOVF_057120 [Spinacia oleracea]|nr:hypothetical protein SOVF_057120 [Spinacia oleracea]
MELSSKARPKTRSLVSNINASHDLRDLWEKKIMGIGIQILTTVEVMQVESHILKCPTKPP